MARKARLTEADYSTVADGGGAGSLDLHEQGPGINGTLARLALRGSFLSDSRVSKTSIGEDWCQNHLADQRLYQLLEKVDGDLIEEARQRGCVHCQGKLYRSDYERKPRGGPQWEERFSLCCGKEGCRRRNTPPSVRFLGRRVYAGLVVVLVAAMVQGLKPERVRRLREALGIDRRTLERWRQWWLGTFVNSAFWRAARARFMPPLDSDTMPLSLCLSFEAPKRQRLIELLGFLAPITTPRAWDALAM